MSTINVNTDNLTLQAVLNLLNNVPKKLEKEVAEAVYNVVQPIIANTLIEYQELFKFFTAVEEFKNEVGLDPVADDQRAELTAQKYVGEDDVNEQAQSEQASATQTEATASTEGEAQTEKANEQQTQGDQVNNDASTAEAQTSQEQEQAKTDPVQNNDTENKGTQAQDQKEQTKLTDEVKAKLAELPKELIELYLAQLKDSSADPEQKKTA